MLVISTWGHPRSWKKVWYVRDENVPKQAKEWKEHTKERVHAHTPLAIYDENVKKVLLIPVSLADDPSLKLEDAAIKSVKEILEEKKEANEIKRVFEESEKLVVPSSGRYLTNKNLKRFDIPFSNVVAGAYVKVCKAICDHKEEDTIVLDITHGQNYHPVIVREALEFMVKLESIRRRKELKFILVTSDPFTILTREEVLNVELGYRVVKVSKVKEPLNELANIVVKPGNPIKGKCEVYEKYTKMLNDLFYDVKKFLVPSPLFWSYVMKKIQEKEDEYVEMFAELMWVITNVVDEGYEVEGDVVKQSVTLDDEQVRNLIALRSAMSTALNYKDVVGEFVDDKLYVVELDKLNVFRNNKKNEMEYWMRELWENEYQKLTNSIRKVKEVGVNEVLIAFKEVVNKLDLEDLKYLAEKNLLPYVILLAISEESSKVNEDRKDLPDIILDAVKQWLEEKEKLDKECKEKRKGSKSSSICDEIVRHFIAHAGLERAVTVVDVNNKRVGYYLPLLSIFEKLLRERI